MRFVAGRVGFPLSRTWGLREALSGRRRRDGSGAGCRRRVWLWRRFFVRPVQSAPRAERPRYLQLYNSFDWQGLTVSTVALTVQEFGLHLLLPFWDARLQDFLSGMPESWGRGLDPNPTKYPLKWMLQHRIDCARGATEACCPPTSLRWATSMPSSIATWPATS